MNVALIQKLPLRLAAFHLKGEELALFRRHSDTLRAMLAPIAHGFRGLREAWPDLKAKLKAGTLYDTKMRHAYVVMSGIFEEEYLVSVDSLARACVEEQIDHVDLLLVHSLTGLELLRQLGAGQAGGQTETPAALAGVMARVLGFDQVNLVDRHRQVVREVTEARGARRLAN